MAVPATGQFKQVSIKSESTWNVVPGASGAQLLPRVSSTLDMSKDTFASKQIQPDRQLRDFRHGVRMVDGTLEGELCPGTWWTIMAAMLGVGTAGASATRTSIDITAAAATPGTFTSAGAISFLTAGFKVGDLVRWTGWVVATANNARNYRITGLTGTVMTVGTAATGAVGQPEAVIARAAGDTVTVTTVGKKLLTPQTSLSDSSFSIEHWFNDVSLSEVYSGLKPDTMSFGLPASGLASIRIGWKGAQITTAGSQYFTSPTSVPIEVDLAAANGTIRVNGVDVAVITGINIDIAGNMEVIKTVGSVLTPDVFPGQLLVKGQFTAAFLDGSFRDLFINETEFAINVVLTTSSAINADFISFYMPRCKLVSDKKDDKFTSITGTYPFQAMNNINGGTGINSDFATIIIQDSQGANVIF